MDITKIKMAYAAYLGYVMHELDQTNFMEHDDVTTMDKIADIASNHEFTVNEEGFIDSEAFYNDGYNDAKKLFDSLVNASKDEIQANDKDSDFHSRQYCYRIFYDLSGCDANIHTEAIYAVINPTCESFMKSPAYANGHVGLYEAVEKYLDEHGWETGLRHVDTSSKDYIVFENFVSLYNQLTNEKVGFTIDESCFDIREHESTIENKRHKTKELERD